MDENRYDKNEVDWPIGQIVIHDADAKERYMLMIVLAKRKNGEIGTRYLFPGLIWDKHSNVPFKSMPTHARKQYGKMWWNDKKHLLDPAKFDIDVSGKYECYWGGLKDG